MSRNKACSYHRVGADNTLPRESLQAATFPCVKHSILLEEEARRFTLKGSKPGLEPVSNLRSNLGYNLGLG